jgi:hypothetical protein
MAPIKVLLDHSVRQDAIIGVHGFKIAEAQFSGMGNRCLQPVTRMRPPRNDWKQNEIEELPRVAELLRSGQIQAFTTRELYAEGFIVQKFPSPQHINIFEQCAFDILPRPLERSKWGIGLDQMCSRENVIAYCECFFITPSPERVEDFILGMRKNPRFSLSPFEEKCLRRAHVFKAICKGIDRKHYPDALHLWTAEENSVGVFLTHDKKFRNVITRQNVDLKCKIQFPSEFLAEFFD